MQNKIIKKDFNMKKSNSVDAYSWRDVMECEIQNAVIKASVATETLGFYLSDPDARELLTDDDILKFVNIIDKNLSEIKRFTLEASQEADQEQTNGQ